MRTMRRRIRRVGVRILDHSLALELLTDADGVVSRAAGRCRQDGWRAWQVRAGAVVLATGGCAFLSGALGLNVDTGDGHLMAAEVGAQLSGMEFSAAYALAPAYGAQTKGLMMQFATYYDESGQTCFLCEAYCPADALFVAPLSAPAPPGSGYSDEDALAAAGAFGAYRRQVGWGPRRTPGSALDRNHLFTARVAPTAQGAPDGPASSR
jgi:hypothetical protein